MEIDGCSLPIHTCLQAIKEEKMEITLGQLSERWANISWGMDPYKGGDVPLLKIAEDDFEALEASIVDGGRNALSGIGFPA